jgi:hypothetical protein
MTRFPILSRRTCYAALTVAALSLPVTGMGLQISRGPAGLSDDDLRRALETAAALPKDADQSSMMLRAGKVATSYDPDKKLVTKEVRLSLSNGRPCAIWSVTDHKGGSIYNENGYCTPDMVRKWMERCREKKLLLRSTSQPS